MVSAAERRQTLFLLLPPPPQTNRPHCSVVVYARSELIYRTEPLSLLLLPFTEVVVAGSRGYRVYFWSLFLLCRALPSDYGFSSLSSSFFCPPVSASAASLRPSVVAAFFEAAEAAEEAARDRCCARFHNAVGVHPPRIFLT